MLAGALAGCGEGHAAAVDSARADSLTRARQDSVNRAQPGYIVDSILPIEEQLRRFRTGLAEAPDSFDRDISTADQLVRTVIRSLEADTGRYSASRSAAESRTYLSRVTVVAPSPSGADPLRCAAAASGTGLEPLNRLGDRTDSSPGVPSRLSKE
jgi:hypothetical protein